MALTICLSCDNSYNELKDKCDKCYKTIEEQIKSFKNQSESIKEELIEIPKTLIKELTEEAFIKGYNTGVRKVNNSIILF